MHRHLYVDLPMAAAGCGLYASAGASAAWPVAAAMLTVHAWASLAPRAGFYMPVQWRLPAGSRGLALTFDDGPHPEITPRVLDRLALHGHRATFFLIGRNAAAQPHLVRRIIAEGHSLGLHSHDHSHLFPCWPPAWVRRDLEQCRAALAAITGGPPPRLFRPPIGIKNPIIGAVAARLGLCTVTWSVRAFDTGLSPSARSVARLIQGTAPRAIAVLHDGHEPTRPRDRGRCLDILDHYLPYLRTRSLRSSALVVSSDGTRALPDPASAS